MLSAAFISEAIPADLFDRYSGLELDMLLALVERLRDGDFQAFIMADRLRALGVLREDLERVVSANWPGTKREAAAALDTTARKALSADMRTYETAVKAGFLAAVSSSLAQSILEGISSEAHRQLESRLALVSTTAVNTSIRTLERAFLLTYSGKESLDKAIWGAVSDMARQGITGAEFPSGRRMEMAPYVRTVVQTSVMQHTRRMGFALMDSFETDLIEISAHAGARPLCAPYQGRVYSRSGKHPKYPPLASTSYGQLAGLFGINCGHYGFPFIEGLDQELTAEERQEQTTVDGKSNDQIYRESQEQRKNERRIRAWKHRADALETASKNNPALEPAYRKAKGKIREWQAIQRQFISETGRTRRYNREKAR